MAKTAASKRQFERQPLVDLLAPRWSAISQRQRRRRHQRFFSGKSNFDYKTAITEALTQLQNAPVLDGHIFGSMRAGTIRIHATDKRAKQNIQNTAITGTRYLEYRQQRQPEHPVRQP